MKPLLRFLIVFMGVLWLQGCTQKPPPNREKEILGKLLTQYQKESTEMEEKVKKASSVDRVGLQGEWELLKSRMERVKTLLSQQAP